MTSTTSTLTSGSAHRPETTDPHLLALLRRYEPSGGSYFARSAPVTQIKRSRDARRGSVRAGFRPL